MGLKIEEEKLYLPSFIGGGVAGLTVDLVLFPLDTLKTRLQAEHGFHRAGGFNGIYKGIGPQAIGSAPQAALFFVTYETIKYYLEPSVPKYGVPAVHMVGASIAEVMACLIRVPIEVVKQRRQTHPGNKSSMRIALSAYKHEGFRKGLYRGFGSTVLREIPFSAIQFSILEYLRSWFRKNFKNNIPLESYEVAVCGSIAGGIAAAVTTPLDVAKTRIMLANRKQVRTGQVTIRNTLRNIYASDGFKGLFAGFVPRVMWITIGGYIFFGSYDFSKNMCNALLTGEY
ncbi:S-adenosylmethionine mitochondrial carrier protein homolog [Leptinotarsa decemlineata]|uniref:S-adenosylmethionine mitochondrial carrier protein homolog n=1 Tax=Leptinotarsa decemlineata TaxID=7539 RepID=UPI000C253F4D|nr:S-adenosylmethionine mitochondrial carrier protein homolog [Leptinotarsa decemlineata]